MSCMRCGKQIQSKDEFNNAICTECENHLNEHGRTFCIDCVQNGVETLPIEFTNWIKVYA